MSEYNEFIGIDELKLTDQAHHRFINPDMVAGKNGVVSDPKIDTGKEVVDCPKHSEVTHWDHLELEKRLGK